MALALQYSRQDNNGRPRYLLDDTALNTRYVLDPVYSVNELEQEHLKKVISEQGEDVWVLSGLEGALLSSGPHEQQSGLIRLEEFCSNEGVGTLYVSGKLPAEVINTLLIDGYQPSAGLRMTRNRFMPYSLDK